ncbi:TolB family protein [Halocola ammonii]
MTKTSILTILFASLAILSCRKDKELPLSPETDAECYEFPFLNISYFSDSRFQYQAPHFNPNNGNEFVYFYMDHEQGEYLLMKHDLSTGTNTEIISSNYKIYRQPKWSRKGWIAFTRAPDYVDHIFMVKENGDSLTQVTQNVGNYDPAWDSTGENLYWQHSPNLAIPYYLLTKPLHSSLPPDTVMHTSGENHGRATHNDISIENRIICRTSINNDLSLGYASLEDFNFTELIDLADSDLIGLTGLTWSNNDQTVYFTVANKGLYKLSVNSGQYTKLINHCDSKDYKNISCSPDGTKMIAERVDRHLEKNEAGNPTGNIIENSSIYMIDLSTLEETKINLD